jgi:signal transduction histidine kinase
MFIYNSSHKIKQVLINLISNSIKFTRKGKITLKVIVLADSNLMFTVKDTGVGIN